MRTTSETRLPLASLQKTYSTSGQLSKPSWVGPMINLTIAKKLRTNCERFAPLTIEWKLKAN